MSRLLARLTTIGGALGQCMRLPSPKRGPVCRILVVHRLLLGDTILLAPLLAKLAAQYPEAERIVLARPEIAPLFSGLPWGWQAEIFDVRDASLAGRLRRDEGFDHAYVLGDNRYAWLARASGARRIIGFAGDTPAWKNWMLDEAHAWPVTPMAWADMAATLVPGPPPPPYHCGAWPTPGNPGFSFPPSPRPYAVLHVGASSPLKCWPATRWQALASALSTRGLDIVWSAGRGEAALVEAADPAGRWTRYCGSLDLPQLWQFIGHASLLICPDTGVAHLGRVIGTPTIALFGPGSAKIHGAGDYWRESSFVALGDTDFPCRDQNILFRRRIEWVRRCQRSLLECPVPRCMEAIAVSDVLLAADTLLNGKPVA